MSTTACTRILLLSCLILAGGGWFVPVASADSREAAVSRVVSLESSDLVLFSAAPGHGIRRGMTLEALADGVATAELLVVESKATWGAALITVPKAGQSIQPGQPVRIKTRKSSLFS